VTTAPLLDEHGADIRRSLAAGTRWPLIAGATG
jgi:hypothetical protein